MTDGEKVAVLVKLKADVEAGRLADGKAVRDALEPLGADVGPFGGASHEMDVALDELTRAAKAKGIDIY